MKVKVISDLHMEFGPYHAGEGEVLILAGDLCIAEDYWVYVAFFRDCVRNYDKVFYICGNHESYDGDLQQTYHILKDCLPAGVSLLENETEEYNGVTFAGATLWTDMNGFDPFIMDSAALCMNDYHNIENGDSLLRAPDTVSRNLNSRRFIEDTAELSESPVFVITHHAPTYQSVQGRYIASKHYYAQDMTGLIETHPNIKYWAHGHIHHNNDYMVGQCRVISNPRGYDKYEENKTFDPDFTLEI